MDGRPGPAGPRGGGASAGLAGRSGTWLVLLMALFAATAFLLFRWYGERALEARGPDTPFQAARERIEADNTLVGVLGGIRRVEPLEVVGENRAGGAAASVSALAVGSRDSARVYLDLAVEDDRWTVVRASARLADGRRLPLEGPERPLLEPAHEVPDLR
ncbi:MAG: hypothetical protein ACREK3_07290 [Gemmatimonadota bacterium]